MFSWCTRFLKSYLLSTTTKLFMQKVLIQPVVIHAKIHAMVIAKSDEEALCSFERRILMCTFGALQKNGKWRRYM
jgi:hypothetical protein